MSDDTAQAETGKKRKRERKPKAREDGDRPERTTGKRRTELNARALQELASLRNSMDEMIERYAIRTGGQLSELMQQISGDETLGQDARPLTVKSAEAALAAIKGAGIKPRKGRGKDFVRLQRLVRKLRSLGPVDH